MGVLRHVHKWNGAFARRLVLRHVHKWNRASASRLVLRHVHKWNGAFASWLDQAVQSASCCRTDIHWTSQRSKCFATCCRDGERNSNSSWRCLGWGWVSELCVVESLCACGCVFLSYVCVCTWKCVYVVCCMKVCVYMWCVCLHVCVNVLCVCVCVQ